MKRMRRRLQQQPLRGRKERRKPVFKIRPHPDSLLCLTRKSQSLEL